MSNPDWLPDIISVNGVWEETLQQLYSIFQRDVINGRLTFEQRPVWYNRRIIEKYEEGFWHLITKEDHNVGRLLDPPRAERLPWLKPTLMNNNDAAVKMWKYRDKRKIKVYIWLEAFDYVIILQSRIMRFGEVFILLTAYYVRGNSTKRKLNKRFSNRIS